MAALLTVGGFLSGRWCVRELRSSPDLRWRPLERPPSGLPYFGGSLWCGKRREFAQAARLEKRHCRPNTSTPSLSCLPVRQSAVPPPSRRSR
jgi:hypothetical protein